jgi:Protein of unknown function (DUF2934)
MSKAQRKTKTIRLVTADHRVITRDDIARRAYELFLARGGAEGHDVEDWLEAERQLEAEAGQITSNARSEVPQTVPLVLPPASTRD